MSRALSGIIVKISVYFPPYFTNLGISAFLCFFSYDIQISCEFLWLFNVNIRGSSGVSINSCPPIKFVWRFRDYTWEALHNLNTVKSFRYFTVTGCTAKCMRAYLYVKIICINKFRILENIFSFAFFYIPLAFTTAATTEISSCNSNVNVPAEMWNIIFLSMLYDRHCILIWPILRFSMMVIRTAIHRSSQRIIKL